MHVSPSTNCISTIFAKLPNDSNTQGSFTCTPSSANFSCQCWDFRLIKPKMPGSLQCNSICNCCPYTLQISAYGLALSARLCLVGHNPVAVYVAGEQPCHGGICQGEGVLVSSLPVAAAAFLCQREG